MNIKVCGITLTQQLQQLDALGVSYAGLIFYNKSPRFAGDILDPDEVSALKLKLKLTGVFVDSGFEYISEMIRSYNLQAVQLCGSEDPELCRKLTTSSEVIKVFHVEVDALDQRLLKDYAESCDLFLFDTKSILPGGSGIRFHWQALNDILIPKQFFLSGGIAPEDVDNIRKFHHPSFSGIDINSRFEVSPGVKDISKIQNFINQL